MKVALFIGGYAEAGKSTTMEMLQDEAIPIFSTSVFLRGTTRAAISFDPLLLNDFDSAYNLRKNEHLPGRSFSPRDLVIHMAENVLVPHLGRESGLVVPVARKAIQQLSSSYCDVVAIETIGGEEYELFERELNSAFPRIKMVRINIRREAEKRMDIRKLLPRALDLHNNVTKGHLLKDLRSVLAMVHEIASERQPESHFDKKLINARLFS